MKHGLQRPTLDHRDRDFLKSFKLRGVAPVFPDEYNTDAGLWMPDQNTVNPEFPNTPSQPNGCTNFTQGDISADLDGKLKDPAVLEALTHANQNGGYDIRESLLMAKRIGWITGFYNIQAYAPLDYFDAIRYAAFSGYPEKRSVSIGTPWYPDWQIDAVRKTSIMSMPPDLNDANLGWHNWKIGGWKTIAGESYLKCKPLEGKNVGDGGWLYFDRPTINAVMALKYTIAFTATLATPPTIAPIDMAAFDKLYSFLRNFLFLRY